MQSEPVAVLVAVVAALLRLVVVRVAQAALLAAVVVVARAASTALLQVQAVTAPAVKSGSLSSRTDNSWPQ
jgi:hypothetical protein